MRVVLDEMGEQVKITVIYALGSMRTIPGTVGEVHQGEALLDISDLQPGLWFLRMEGLNGDVTLKFTIVR
jgi:hypothetical protein